MIREVFNLQNYQWSIHAVAPIVSCSISVFFSFFIFLKNKKSLLNITLSAFAVFTAVWQFSTAMMFMSQTDALAIFWDRKVYLAVALMFPVAYHFAVLLAEAKQQKNWIRSGYIIAVIYLFLSQTGYFVSDLYRYKWGCHAIARILHHPFVLISTFYYLKSVYLVFRKYTKTSSLQKRQQYKYYFLGYFIYVIATIAYLPAYKIGIYPIAYWFATFYVIIVGYSIVRYHLMEIDTVIHRTALWVLTSSMIFVPIGAIVYLIRPWLAGFNWLALTFLAVILVYVYLYSYPRIQPRIDHLFRRRKYDYYKVLEELGQRIGSELELEKVHNRLFRELREILYIRNGLLLVQQPGQEGYEEVGSVGYQESNDQASKSKQAVSLLFLPFNSKLSEYINRDRKVLEREQIEADPQYKEIKEEALEWFKQREIDILIPIVLEGKVNGLLGIGKKENLQAYTQKDIELLEKMGKQLGITIDNALHHGDIVEKERLAEELRLGQEIQMNLLPRVVPEVNGLKLAGMMIPAKEIGGDYYDFIITRQSTTTNKLGIIIGDVSGKGVAAGLIMATAKATLKGLSQQGLTPKEMLTQANSIIHEYTNGEKFMTMLYFQWDNEQKKMSYSSAGHEHIIIYRKQITDKNRDAFSINHQLSTINSSVEVILSGGFMIGMMPEIGEMLEDKELSLQQGDKVVLYTDGVTEARNQAKEMYSLERLTETVKQHGHRPYKELISSIKEDLYAFIGSAEQYDDITLVVMEMR